MAGYSTPIDIANRACQHCGVSRIDLAQGFTEDSKQADETGFVYDKLRRAELRRNPWNFAIKRAVLRPIDATFRLLSPSLWSGSTTYFAGSLVTDLLGVIWLSTMPNNLNRSPGYERGWVMYFGPMAVPAYDATGGTAYFAGDVVYVSNGNGTYTVYYSTAQSNSSVPGTVEAFDATVVYRKGDLVSYSSTNYLSLIDFNLNQTPASVAAFNSATSYSIGNVVAASNGYQYTSKTNANVGNDPVADIAATNWTLGALVPWTTTTDGRGVSSKNWQALDTVLDSLQILSPVQSGPVLNSEVRNLYRKPANFLHLCVQDPKAGSQSYLGGPSGYAYSDWLLEGDYIVTRETDPIILRFVADFIDVSKMDDMFCEGLAARIAVEVVEPLTQSAEKQQRVASMYQKFMSEARLVNGIESGAAEPPEDDWVACRL